MNTLFGFNILFFVVLGLTTATAFFLGEEKSQRLVIGVLAGSFATTEFSVPLANLLTGKVAFTNQAFLAIFLMIICVAICLLGKNVQDKKWPKSRIKAVISGALSGLVAMSYVISSLPADQRNTLLTDYNLASLSYDLRLYLLAALIVWLLFTYVSVGKAKK